MLCFILQPLCRLSYTCKLQHSHAQSRKCAQEGRHTECSPNIMGEGAVHNTQDATNADKNECNVSHSGPVDAPTIWTPQPAFISGLDLAYCNDYESFFGKRFNRSRSSCCPGFQTQCSNSPLRPVGSTAMGQGE